MYSKLLSVYAGNRGNIYSSIFLGSVTTIWRIKGEDGGPPSFYSKERNYATEEENYVGGDGVDRL